MATTETRRRRVTRAVAGTGAIVLLVATLAPPLVRAFLPAPGRELTATDADALTGSEVTFVNEHDGLALAGRLFLPDGDGPLPAAAIINGSGPSHRSNGRYLTLTAPLVDGGVAVLLPDKRGSDASAGDWRTASFDALDRDATTSVDALVAHPAIDPNGVGVIGMSQGGRIAPLVAEQHDGLAYAVSFVGGVLPAHASLRYEEVHNLRELGFLPGVSDVLAHATSRLIIAGTQRQFWAAVGNFDPLPHWGATDTGLPVRFQFGGADTNTDTSGSVRRLTALQRPNLRVEVYDGSGHALEDPPDRGNALIRSDALADLDAFIHEATATGSTHQSE